MTAEERLIRINAEIAVDSEMPPIKAAEFESFAAAAAAPAKKYHLLAEGDSWFDYPLGRDVLDYLNNYFKHPVTKLARAGSTLNELVYGPDELFRSDPQQGKTRLTKVVEQLRKNRFDAFLFSGGGNDIAGPEFFSFINHAASALPNPNQNVLDGVVNGTFQKAYEDMIEVLQTEAGNLGIKLPIFVHGYDYPWPDGRGAVALGIALGGAVPRPLRACLQRAPGQEMLFSRMNSVLVSPAKKALNRQDRRKRGSVLIESVVKHR